LYEIFIETNFFKEVAKVEYWKDKEQPGSKIQVYSSRLKFFIGFD